MSCCSYQNHARNKSLQPNIEFGYRIPGWQGAICAPLYKLAHFVSLRIACHCRRPSYTPSSEAKLGLPPERADASLTRRRAIRTSFSRSSCKILSTRWYASSLESPAFQRAGGGGGGVLMVLHACQSHEVRIIAQGKMMPN